MATAYANDICVVVTNRTGRERDAFFPGQSCLASPWGTITTLGEGEERAILEIPFDEIPDAKRPSPHNDLQTDPRMVIAAPMAGGEPQPRRRGRMNPARGMQKRP